MSSKTLTVNDDTAEPWWGLNRNVIPCFGARLVQEGNRLHYLSDRASIIAYSIKRICSVLTRHFLFC